MAVKTLYVASGNDGNFAALVDGTAQAAASRADGWTVAKLASGNMSDFDVGTKQASGTFAVSAKPASFLTGTTANAFKSPAALLGTFAATAWTFTFAARCTLASAQQGRIRLRVFKSKNADGSAAVELTGATVVGTIGAVTSTSVDTALPVTWSPGTTIRLDNEYLFFVVAWEITTVAGSNSADVVLRTGSTGPAGSRLVTPDFVASSQLFGTFALPLTFSRSIAGFVPANPTWTTPIDDFNRADGKVYAGTGSTIWETFHVDSAALTNVNVIGNRLGSTSAFYWATTKDSFASDCDLIIDCVVAGNVTLGVCMSDVGTSLWNGITVGYDSGSSAWWATQYVDGSGGSFGGQAASAPQAGDSYWMSRRGSTLKLYRSVSGGPWTQIGSWAGFSVAAPFDKGRFAISPNDTTQRWDNLRGGPVVAPTATQYGAVSASFTFGQTISGTRKTFGQVARPFTFTPDTRGTRKTFGVVARPFTFTADLRGSRKAFGQIARPFLFDSTVKGATFPIVKASPTTLTGNYRTGQHIVPVTVFGVISRAFLFTPAIAGRKQTFGAISRPFTFTASLAGSRKAFGTITRPFVFGAAVQGRRTAFGQVTRPFVFGANLQGRRKTFGVINRPFLFGATVAGIIPGQFTVLNNANNVYLGVQPANSVYAGGNKVWP